MIGAHSKGLKCVKLFRTYWKIAKTKMQWTTRQTSSATQKVHRVNQWRCPYITTPNGKSVHVRDPKVLFEKLENMIRR